MTHWSWPTPHSITPTSPGSVSSESVARVTGVGGHSVLWSLTSSSHIVGYRSIGRTSQVRTGGGWSNSQSYAYTYTFVWNANCVRVTKLTLTSYRWRTPSPSSKTDPDAPSSESVARIAAVDSYRAKRSVVRGSSIVDNSPLVRVRSEQTPVSVWKLKYIKNVPRTV